MTHEVRLEPGEQQGRSLAPYIWSWVVAGLLAGPLLMLVAPADRPPSVARLLILLALTTGGEWVSLNLRAGSSGMSLSLLEAAVVIDLLLLPPPYAVGVILLGVSLRHYGRLPAEKLAFNLGQHAVAGSAAAAVVAIVPTVPTVSATRFFAAAAAVLIYSVVNTMALAGIFSRLRTDSVSEQLTERPVFLMATTLGNASIGLIAVALWTAYPTIVWLVGGPALALYLSYGSSFRIETLLTEVRAESDRLNRVVGGVQEGIVLLDETGRIGLWNASLERILGVTSAEAIGRTASDLLLGADANGSPIHPESALDRVGLDEMVQTATLTAADGTKVPARLSHTLLRDERDRCIGDVIVIQDLSREREAAALKEDFVARVSHELRTPLTPLRGYAQALLRFGDRVPAERRDGILEEMVERVGHMEQLIDDLLLVSRIASGRIDPAREVDCTDVDLDELVPRLITWLASEEGATGELVVVADGDAPHIAWGDGLRTGQIITNLLTNARKYAAPGTPVRIELTTHEDAVTVVVRDQGPGIPEDKLEAVFERFHRLENPQEMRTGGLGLGLYISRHLAEAMGGSLTATSENGVGSAFTLRLPRPEPGRVPTLRQAV